MNGWRALLVFWNVWNVAFLVFDIATGGWGFAAFMFVMLLGSAFVTITSWDGP